MDTTLAHKIEERGVRHFGLHLESGLKLRVALGDGERRGGHVGVFFLAQFGLQLDVIVCTVIEIGRASCRERV